MLMLGVEKSPHLSQERNGTAPRGRDRGHEGMKKAFAYVLLGFMAIGLLLSTGCFETTAHNISDLKDWTDVTFLDGDRFGKATR